MLKIPPPVIGLLIAIAMWLLSKYLPIYPVVFPYQTAVAAVVLVIGLVIDFSALWSFRKAKTTINPLKPENSSSVVTTGIYRYSRNPMYLGMLLILVAIAIYLCSVSPFLLLPVFVWIITVNQIIPEEKILTGLFGHPYIEYLTAVRRWI